MTNKNNNTLSINNFGLNLYRIRTEKKMTREQLADEIGLATPRIVYDYENNIKRPTIDRLILIAKALGVSLNSMFE